MKEAEIMYQATPYIQRDGLVETHLDFVNFIVHRMRPQIPDFIALEDMKSAALYGLMDAAGRFDPGKGILFKTFAEPRIRGAVLDEIRKLDWFSRSLREKQSRVLREMRRLEQILGRAATEEEIAASLELKLEEYQKVLKEIGHLGIVSLHEHLNSNAEGESFLDQLEDVKGKSPEEALNQKDLVRQLAGELDRLSEKERLVLTLFYYEEFTQKEIAGILSLSEGRISQLHSQALLKLKAGMQKTGT